MGRCCLASVSHVSISVASVSHVSISGLHVSISVYYVSSLQGEKTCVGKHS